MKEPKLTVNVVTYNHSKYIKKCLDSLIEQETNFKFLIRIFDDCSTDGTIEICKQYAQNYPELIQLFCEEKNIGSKANAYKSYQNIESPYYMYIEGDDYICNKKRFQKQIDILNKHKECSFSAGHAKDYYDDEDLFLGGHPWQIKSGIYSMEYYQKYPKVQLMTHISTRIVRSSCIRFDESDIGIYLNDITQMFELLRQGSMYYINETFGIYRITNSGFYTGSSAFFRIRFLLNNMDNYNKYTDRKYENIILWLLKLHIEWGLNINILDFKKFKVKKYKSFLSKIKEIKHYSIPRFILDIFNIPRDFFRFIKNFFRREK